MNQIRKNNILFRIVAILIIVMNLSVFGVDASTPRNRAITKTTVKSNTTNTPQNRRSNQNSRSNSQNLCPFKEGKRYRIQEMETDKVIKMGTDCYLIKNGNKITMHLGKRPTIEFVLHGKFYQEPYLKCVSCDVTWSCLDLDERGIMGVFYDGDKFTITFKDLNWEKRVFYVSKTPFSSSGNNTNNTSDRSYEYNDLDQQPEFPGGMNGLAQFLGNNSKYPSECQEKGIEGKVHVKFTVFQNGQIGNVNVVRAIHPLLDAEAVRVISIFPKWKPGKLNGKPVDVPIILPIDFKLFK